ncbi:MAG TPA: hypothetical protein VLW54_15435, partial [Candidatus Acidoferrales bacterium]|nr:hypothetical protein [Candidatus Acidoferrales bacterium]
MSRISRGAPFGIISVAVCLCLVVLQPAAAPGAASPAATAKARPFREPVLDELSTLSRALRQRDTAVNYEHLAAFAREHEADASGPVAALALGYRDYERGRFPDAAAWFGRAEKTEVLPDY